MSSEPDDLTRVVFIPPAIQTWTQAAQLAALKMEIEENLDDSSKL